MHAYEFVSWNVDQASPGLSAILMLLGALGHISTWGPSPHLLPSTPSLSSSITSTTNLIASRRPTCLYNAGCQSTVIFYCAVDYWNSKTGKSLKANQYNYSRPTACDFLRYLLHSLSGITAYIRGFRDLIKRCKFCEVNFL